MFVDQQLQFYFLKKHTQCRCKHRLQLVTILLCILTFTREYMQQSYNNKNIITEFLKQ